MHKKDNQTPNGIKGTSFVQVGTITVPDIFFRPINTDIPEINMALSELGGMIPSQSIFATGKPGSGKTTLFSVVAANITKLNPTRPAAFGSLEMSDFQLAAMGRKIPGFKEVIVSTVFDIEETIAELKKLNPSVFVLDSIQKAAGKMPGGKNANQIKIVDALTKFAKETFIPVVLIGHVNKAGVYIGPTHLLHEVDTHFLVNYDRDNDLRTFNTDKNRFGGSNFEYLFGIGSDKVWVGNPYLDDSVAPPIKKHNPDLDISKEKMKEVLDKFIADNSTRPSISESTSRAFCDIWLSHMKNIDKEDIEKRSKVGSVDKISLLHDYNGVAQCMHKHGKAFIRMGDKMFKDDFKIGNIGYGKEQKFIKSNCVTREDLFVWVLIHEWCHLYKDHSKHTVEFFEEVQKVYRKYTASLA